VSRYLRGRVPGRGRLLPDAVQAIQYLEAAGQERPVLLAYHPVARVNPYTALLHGKLWSRGVAPVPVIRFTDLEALLPLAERGDRIVLHLQWTSDVLKEATTDAEAKDLAGEFLDRLDRFLGAGGRLVWTVHNVLPHDCPFPRAEAALQQAVADRAGLIHVLNAGTADAAAQWFTIEPEKTVLIPHPHYRGTYPDFITKDQARYELGVGPEEIVYAFVGAIKPYKGLEELLDAMDALRGYGDRPRRLLVAGKPDEDPETQQILDRTLLHPDTLLRPTAVPDMEMQYYLRAADLGVLPYRKSLNSGVLLLALSFGLPVVTADTPAAAEIVTPEIARTFQAGDTASLVEAMKAADELLDPAAQQAAVRAAERFDPAGIAQQFADAIADRAAAGDTT
jgi:beta-1,4-mannosyltransferase